MFALLSASSGFAPMARTAVLRGAPLALRGGFALRPFHGLAPRRRVLRLRVPLPRRVAVLRLRGPRVFRRARSSADTLSIDEQGAARDAPEASLAEGVAAGQGHDGFRRL